MKIMRNIAVLAAALPILSLAACSSGVDRSVDVSAGEYYTTEEFDKLSDEQRDAYCAALDARLAEIEAERSEANGATQQAQQELSSVRSELDALRSEYEAKKGSVEGLEGDIDHYEGLPKSHTVVEGEFLRKISSYEKIYADEMKWPRIYRANKDRIEDPNLIYPGWELKIPRDWPMSWTVSEGEYLARIAGYWEVYGKRSEWPRIHEANKDKIKDPDLIYPGWELTIPREMP